MSGTQQQLVQCCHYVSEPVLRSSLPLDSHSAYRPQPAIQREEMHRRGRCWERKQGSKLTRLPSSVAIVGVRICRSCRGVFSFLRVCVLLIVCSVHMLTAAAVAERRPLSRVSRERERDFGADGPEPRPGAALHPKHDHQHARHTHEGNDTGANTR